jgi:hypothetical protein
VVNLRQTLHSAQLVDGIGGLRFLPTGTDAGWHALVVPSRAGFMALARLRHCETPLGPVLYDSPGERLYFAIPPGSHGTWGELPVRLLGDGAWLIAPDPHRSEDWFGGWCELPDTDDLTDPALLRRVLHDVRDVTSELPTSKETPAWNLSSAPALTPTSDASPRASRPTSALRRF